MEDSHCSLSQGQESSRRVASQCCASFPLVGCVGDAVIRLGLRNPRKKERKAFTCNYNFTSSRILVFCAGNMMTKKRSRLKCDNMEELVYLHQVLAQVREWEVVMKMRLE